MLLGFMVKLGMEKDWLMQCHHLALSNQLNMPLLQKTHGLKML